VNAPLMPEQRVQLEEFRRDHPEISIGCEFDTWQAVVPQDDGERFLARRDLPRLLGDTEDILAGGDPRAGPG
jgi:hypothetical protein